ncbi:Lin1 family protein [Plectosphaerella cucumerina]|uniref:Lin1 family protein n=1 Tax=Plectosphaerella cucumerina TaxID=40658 RepID=A0A8K0WZD1_9PEZI|nr:Lin1 family protein [Plectosphaerella cucumerina]
MASRHSAARPKRDGENFARTHHHDDDGPDSNKKVKFDVRNPSALAPDAREDDVVLDADVIGGGGGTKRGAVNIDGYDSDSDNETFAARADKRPQGSNDILHQLDNYDAKSKGGPTKAADPDDDDDDMFAEEDGQPDKGEGGALAEGSSAARRKAKEVHFLEDTDIVGQELDSKGGGQVRLDDEESSDEDEEERVLAVQEEGIDEEVGLGGLKRNAPKLEAFNMKDEQEEGRFDADGNYVRKAADPDSVHDKWLDGLSKKDMKKAAEAHEKRELEARRQRMEDDNLLTTDLLKTLILCLEKGETSLEALARLGKGIPKPKKVPKWKLKKQNKGAEGMDVDEAEKAADPELTRKKEAIAAITDAADKLLGREHLEIYDEERELLIRKWQRETGEDWTEPSRQDADDKATTTHWEFRWTDGRDNADKQGPYDGATMKAWQDAGYFGEGVEFRPADTDSEWTRVADFV